MAERRHERAYLNWLVYLKCSREPAKTGTRGGAHLIFARVKEPGSLVGEVPGQFEILDTRLSKSAFIPGRQASRRQISAKSRRGRRTRRFFSSRGAVGRATAAARRSSNSQVVESKRSNLSAPNSIKYNIPVEGDRVAKGIAGQVGTLSCLDATKGSSVSKSFESANTDLIRQKSTQSDATLARPRNPKLSADRVDRKSESIQKHKNRRLRPGAFLAGGTGCDPASGADKSWSRADNSGRQKREFEQPVSHFRISKSNTRGPGAGIGRERAPRDHRARWRYRRRGWRTPPQRTRCRRWPRPTRQRRRPPRIHRRHGLSIFNLPQASP